MDEVFTLIIDIWHRIIGYWDIIRIQFSIFDISLFDFILGLIVFSLLFRILLILPNRDSVISLGSAVSERIRKSSDKDRVNQIIEREVRKM